MGAISRYGLAGLMQRLGGVTFPLGTLGVNVLGCALAGALMFFSDDRLSVSSQVRIFFGIGFLGSFTTFSTFSYETIELIKESQFILAMIYVMANVILCLAALWLVYSLMKFIYS